MSSLLFERVAIAGLLGFLSFSAGCDNGPSSPSPLASRPPATQTGPVTVTRIVPARGLAGETVTVEGTGFVPGATVRLDGAEARVTAITDGLTLRAVAPAHTPGTVDVVVTNPGGESAKLVGGYTFEVVTLSVSSTLVRPGGQLTVTWDAPGKRSNLDWIALFKVGDPSTSYEEGRWDYTKGAASGTFTLNAPPSGEYEFRYLLDDDYVDVARIGPITVRN